MNDRNLSSRSLVPAQRRQLIADQLRAEGSVSVAALEAGYGISPMTARRDLQILEREGRARRTHGGAILPVRTREEDAFQSRLEEAADAKRRLGAAAAALIEEDETVFVDCSSTAFYAVRSLLDSGKPATVLTNGVVVMDLIARTDAPQIELIGLAGSLRRLTCSFVGPQTVRAVEDHFADKLLFSVKGLAPGHVLTDANPLEAEVKRAMIERSRESILLIDHSKFDRPGLSAIAPVTAIETVLVSGGDREHLRALAGTGVRVQELP